MMFFEVKVRLYTKQTCTTVTFLFQQRITGHYLWNFEESDQMFHLNFKINSGFAFCCSNNDLHETHAEQCERQTDR